MDEKPGSNDSSGDKKDEKIRSSISFEAFHSQPSRSLASGEVFEPKSTNELGETLLLDITDMIDEPSPSDKREKNSSHKIDSLYIDTSKEEIEETPVKSSNRDIKSSRNNPSIKLMNRLQMFREPEEMNEMIQLTPITIATDIIAPPYQRNFPVSVRVPRQDLRNYGLYTFERLVSLFKLINKRRSQYKLSFCEKICKCLIKQEKHPVYDKLNKMKDVKFDCKFDIHTNTLQTALSHLDITTQINYNSPIEHITTGESVAKSLKEALDDNYSLFSLLAILYMKEHSPGTLNKITSNAKKKNKALLLVLNEVAGIYLTTGNPIKENNDENALLGYLREYIVRVESHLDQLDDSISKDTHTGTFN